MSKLCLGRDVKLCKNATWHYTSRIRSYLTNQRPKRLKILRSGEKSEVQLYKKSDLSQTMWGPAKTNHLGVLAPPPPFRCGRGLKVVCHLASAIWIGHIFASAIYWHGCRERIFSEHIQRFKPRGNILNSSHFDAPNTKFAPTGYRRAPNIISQH